MFKFISCVNLSKLSHFWIKIISYLAVPICLSGCITITLYCFTERALAAERQEMVELGSSSYNFGNRLPNFGIDVISSEVKSNFRINVFKFCINGISELFRGNKIISYGIPAESNKTSEKTYENGKIPSGERDKIIDNIIYHCILGIIIGLLMTAPLWFGHD